MWRKAPLALVRRPALFAGCRKRCRCSRLSPPRQGRSVRAGIESEALKGKLGALTPLAAGLTIERQGTSSTQTAAGLARADTRRRAAAERLARALPSTGTPVITSSTSAALGGKAFEGGIPLVVIPMARDAATEHVQRIAGGGSGAWVSSALTRTPSIHPGGRLSLIAESLGPGAKPPLTVPIAAVYRQLDADLGNPYWVNFIARIRARNPDSRLPPTFVLLDRARVYAIAHDLSFGSVSNVYELPVDARSMTPAAAKRSVRAYADVERSLTGQPRSRAGSVATAGSATAPSKAR